MNYFGDYFEPVQTHEYIEYKPGQWYALLNADRGEYTRTHAKAFGPFQSFVSASDYLTAFHSVGTGELAHYTPQVGQDKNLVKKIQRAKI